MGHACFPGWLTLLAAPACAAFDPHAGALVQPPPDGDPDAVFTDDERSLLASLTAALPLSPPPDPTNDYADHPGAIALGQRLFATRIFSGPLLDPSQNGGAGALGVVGEAGKVACADCHVPSSDFSDTRSPGGQISLGAGWGRRRAPSLLDVGQARLLMWDGRRDTLYDQVFGPLESPVELNSSRLFVAEQVFLSFRAPYEAVFGSLPPLDDGTRFAPIAPADAGCHPLGAIPGRAGGDPNPPCGGPQNGVPGDGAAFDALSPVDQIAVTRVVVNVGKAIGAYERRLACGASRFDRWLQGDATALSRAEQRGAEIFVGPGRCVSCHSGPFLSDGSFHNVGLSPALVRAQVVDSDDRGALLGVAAARLDPLDETSLYSDGDDGRLPAAIPPSWEGAFRTPTLRCVSRRPSFFHTGQALTLDDVVDFFADGGSTAGFFGQSELVALALTEGQRRDLIAFLGALDGPGADPSLQVDPALAEGAGP